MVPAIALPPALDRVLRDYERAWRDGDGRGLAALFTVDGLAVQSGSAVARGREAIARNITGPGGALQLAAYAFSTSGSVGYIVGGYRYPGAQGPTAASSWRSDWKPTGAGASPRTSTTPARFRPPPRPMTTPSSSD